MTEYLDDMGRVIMVSQGIGEMWFSCRVKKSKALQRVKSKYLPERSTAEEAQDDLNRYAKRMGWQQITKVRGKSPKRKDINLQGLERCGFGGLKKR